MSGILRALSICLLAGGCGLVDPFRSADEPPPAGAADPGAATAEPATTEPATEDPPAPEEPAAATLPATTVASLGDVARPGLWMRTPLVSAPMRGRVIDPATGASVVLDLIPLEAAPGAGSRLSLAAYQALGLPLTSLPELRVEPAG
jgi:hypothetical protein